jgi:hypothetical protein
MTHQTVMALGDQDIRAGELRNSHELKVQVRGTCSTPTLIKTVCLWRIEGC